MADSLAGSDLYVLGLLRHAKSDYPAGVEDHGRPLSDRGRRDAPAVGSLVASQMGELDLALVSDATRAQQTWDLSGAKARDKRDEPRVYEASTNALMAVVVGIDPAFRSVLMVGHNPGFEALAQHLAGEGSDGAALTALNEKYPTCALAVLESPAPFSQWTSAAVRLRSFDIARGN